MMHPKFAGMYTDYMAIMSMDVNKTMSPKEYGMMLQGKKKKKRGADK